MKCAVQVADGTDRYVGFFLCVSMLSVVEAVLYLGAKFQIGFALPTAAGAGDRREGGRL